MSAADQDHFIPTGQARRHIGYAARRNELPQIIISLAAGFFLVAGTIYPELGILFYPALFIGIMNFSRIAILSRLAIYAFWLPYSLLLGLAVWQQVFPLFSGIVLALLLGDLFSRITYMLLKYARQSVWRFFILPLVLFWIEFTFQVLPLLNKIHLVPFLAPISYHYHVLSGASWYGGPFLLLLLGMICALAATGFAADIRPAAKTGYLVALACCLVLVFLPGAMANESPAVLLRAASIQGSFEPEDPEADYEKILAEKLDHYLVLALSGKSDITVFPETDLGIYDVEGKTDGLYRQSLAKAAEDLGGIAVITVLEGSSLTRSKDDRYISSLVYDKGLLAGISRKRNLVPFSESERYSAGDDYQIIAASKAKVGVSICYDINAMTVEKLCREGAQIILAPFNDGGFNRVYKNIHRYYPIIKAASCQVPVVVANESGISQIISKQGRILAELMSGETGRIAADVELKQTRGLYLRYGFYISYAVYWAITILAIAVFFRTIKEYRKRKRKIIGSEANKP